MDRTAPRLMAPDSSVADLPVPGLLRLAPETRRCIYQHAGLAYKQHYDLTAPAVYDLGEPSSSASFYGLLSSRRTIHVEASALLYSANRFIIRYQPRRSLTPIRALTPRTLACLTNLKVVLNQTSCHHRPGAGDEGYVRCCGNDDSASAPCCTIWHVNNHDMPLDGSVALTNALLEEWRTTAAYLASHVVPGQLELTLVCDVHHDDPETAKRVLDGLRLLPVLKDCHIRLCGTSEPQLQQLAQEAAFTGVRYHKLRVFRHSAPPQPPEGATAPHSRIHRSRHPLQRGRVEESIRWVSYRKRPMRRTPSEASLPTGISPRVPVQPMLGKALTGTVHWLLLPPPTRSLFIPLPMLGSANAVVPRLQSPLLGRKPSFVQREPFHRRRWPKQLPSCGVAARRLPPQVLRGQSVLAGRCPSPLPWAPPLP